jgi:hypothetical protein
MGQIVFWLNFNFICASTRLLALFLGFIRSLERLTAGWAESFLTISRCTTTVTIESS